MLFSLIFKLIADNSAKFADVVFLSLSLSQEMYTVVGGCRDSQEKDKQVEKLSH